MPSASVDAAGVAARMVVPHVSFWPACVLLHLFPHPYETYRVPKVSIASCCRVAL